MPPFFRRLCTTSDGRVVVGQSPNVAAFVAGGLSVLSLLPTGAAQIWIGRAAGIAWLYWAALEIFAGVNTFRRILGTVVAIVVLVGLFRLR